MEEEQCRDILDHYNNPELIYKGGQRIVYRFDHPEYGVVALKVGRYKTPDNPNGWDIERIEREINILQDIDSQYYPKNFCFKKLPDGRYIIIEEFIDSTPLSHCMDTFKKPSEALNLIKNLVIGLNVIWKMNVVHRDLKPDNILIKESNLPTIIDLGIARSLDSTSITETLLGGPCSKLYAAPEQLHYDKKRIDKRTDQYNLGIILVQLLLKGTHPFDPSLVGGNSIPHNIINGNWYTSIFNEPVLSPIFPLASQLLSPKPYQRFRFSNMILDKIDSCLEVYQ
ncbi:protein kinase domain-containing protein [Methanofollis fontis]|uniref:protein kinase domain-containing protein n=1 Tax=Methanofollis fontis TaxID=2052832 RepID=UPI0013EEA5E2|nr:protein kinase [Methanofollis fontis]